MSLNLPALTLDMDANALMLASGQIEEKRGLGLPSLRVNYDDQTDDGKPIPRGQWSIQTDNGPVFSTSVDLRILMNTYQYSHFDVETMKPISTSAHFIKFGDEAPDDAGGMKCGKVAKKLLDGLTDAEKAIQSKIKLSKVLFGTVSCKGKDVDGKDVVVTDLPCVFYARGTHFMPMTEFIDVMGTAKKPIQTVVITMTLKREKNGGVVFWIVQPVESRQVKLTQADLDLVQKFAETAKAENEVINEKWRKAQSKKGSPDMLAVAKAVNGKKAGPVDPSLNDAPFDLDGTNGDLAGDFVVQQ